MAHAKESERNPGFFSYKMCVYAGVAELADAPDLGSGGRPCRFKSCHPHVGVPFNKGLFFCGRRKFQESPQTEHKIITFILYTAHEIKFQI